MIKHATDIEASSVKFPENNKVGVSVRKSKFAKYMADSALTSMYSN